MSCWKPRAWSILRVPFSFATTNQHTALTPTPTAICNPESNLNGAAKQTAMADRLILNKMHLVTTEELHHLEADCSSQHCPRYKSPPNLQPQTLFHFSQSKPSFLCSPHRPIDIPEIPLLFVSPEAFTTAWSSACIIHSISPRYTAPLSFLLFISHHNLPQPHTSYLE
ncbi:hypothetical protein B0O80DRAFT_238525 [Mortierella sp. GBAus27b]|nr:hypothetical protein B0O80DRAFT_238525 [Mortierella sp. GBAus27b]